MRVERLKLESFGIRSGLCLDGLKPGANVIYGPNEAGKTTLMEAVRAVLFGFIDKRSKRNRFEPGHGGDRRLQLDLNLKSGSRWRLDRTEGKGGLVIRDLEAGLEIPESRLTDALKHCERTLYESIFAFSLSELTSLEALDATAVHDRLLGAALGAGAVSPAAALALLGSRRDKCYKPNSKTKLSTARNRLKDARRSIAGLRNFPQEHEEIVARIEKARERREALQAQCAAIEHDIAERSRLQESRSSWQDLQAALIESRPLRHAAHMPVDAKAKLDSAVAERERSLKDLEDQQQEVHARKARFEGIRYSADIEKLLPHLDKFLAATSQRDRFPTALTRARKSAEDAAKNAEQKRLDCGSSWTEEKARKMPDIRPLQAEARRSRKSLENAQTKLATDRANLAHADQRLSRLTKRSDAAKSETDELLHLSTLPHDAGERVSKLGGEIEASKSREGAERAEAAHRTKCADEIAVDHTAASHLPAIERARNRLQAHSHLPGKLAHLREELRIATEATENALRKCGQDGNEEKVREWASSGELDSTTASWRETLSQAVAKVNEVRDRLAKCRESLAEQETALGDYFTNGWSPPEGDDRKSAVKEECARQTTGLDSMRQLLDELRALHAKQAEVKSVSQRRTREAQAAIEKLPGEWTEAGVRGVPTTSSFLQEVQAFAEKLATLEQEQHTAVRILESLELATKNTQEKIDGLEATSADEGPDLKTDPQMLNHCRGWLDTDHELHMLQERANGVRSELADLEERRSTAKTFAVPLAGIITLLVAGLAVAGALLWTGNTGAALVAAASAAGISLFLFYLHRNADRNQEAAAEELRRRSEKLKDDLTKLQGRISDQEVKLAAHTEKLTDIAPLDRTNIESALEKAYASLERSREIQGERDRLEWQRSRLDDQRHEQEQARDELDKAKACLADSSEEWARILDGSGLQSTTTPGRTAALLIDIRSVTSKLEEATEADHNHEELASQVEGLEEKMESLLEKYGHPGSPGDRLFQDACTKWQRHVGALDQAIAAIDTLDVAGSRATEASRDLENLGSNLEDKQGEWRQWLKDNGFSNEQSPRDVQRRMPLIRAAAQAVSDRDRAARGIGTEESAWRTLCDDIAAETGITPGEKYDAAELRSNLEEAHLRYGDLVEQSASREDHLQEARKATGRAEQERRTGEDIARRRDALLEEWGIDSVASFNSSRDDIERYHELRKDLERIASELKSEQLARDTAAATVHRATEIAKEEAAKHGQFLERNSLPTNLDAEALVGQLDAIGDYKAALGSLVTAKDEEGKITQRWQKMLSDYEPLLSAAGLGAEIAEAEPTVVIGRITRALSQLEDVRDKHKERERRRNEQEQAESRLKQLTVIHEERQAHVKKLIGGARAATEDEFRRWDQDATRLRELGQTTAQLEAGLQATLGISDAEELGQRLQATDWEDEARELVELQSKSTDMSNELSEIDQGIGSDETLRSQQEQSDELARHRQEEECALAELEAAAEEWLLWSTAVALVEKARDKVEKECQPLVLQRASSYLAKLTDGAFTDIHVRLGEREMRAVRADGTQVPLLHMSRGSVEPFYLALRLALIDDYANDETGAPPVLMDDILVNFDDSRSRFAAQAVQQLSEKAQVLLLTCHERTVDNFRSLGGDVNIVELPSPYSD